MNCKRPFRCPSADKASNHEKGYENHPFELEQEDALAGEGKDGRS